MTTIELRKLLKSVGINTTKSGIILKVSDKGISAAYKHRSGGSFGLFYTVLGLTGDDHYKIDLTVSQWEQMIKYLED